MEGKRTHMIFCTEPYILKIVEKACGSANLNPRTEMILSLLDEVNTGKITVGKIILPFVLLQLL